MKAKGEKADGEQYAREKGTPQGGVISPLLANLYLHFALDQWLSKYYSSVPFVRYADDVVLHCVSKEEAEQMLKAINDLLKKVGLTPRVSRRLRQTLLHVDAHLIKWLVRFFERLEGETPSCLLSACLCRIYTQAGPLR